MPQGMVGKAGDDRRRMPTQQSPKPPNDGRAWDSQDNFHDASFSQST